MSSPRSILFVCAAVTLALLTFGRAARAVEFHFTVTADPRGQHSAFGGTLAAINGLVGGPGAFHVSPGDVDPIPQNRAQIDTHFGSDALWYPGVGNHEEETPADMVWLRNEYNNGNGVRTPLKDFTNQDGPPSSKETTYTWDYGNAHFVQLNQYWNGFSDTATSGDIVTPLYDWLAADLAANTRPAVFVFGHEPAFPYYRHIGDSLDQYPSNRDRFWQLLEDYDVMAFFCGHTHGYSTHQGDVNHNGDVWQVDVGNAGNGSPQTFVDVIVGDSDVTFETYNNAGGWGLLESWTQPIPVWSTSLTWDENGPGYWGHPRWTGDSGPDVPDDLTHVEIKADTVTVAANAWALTLTVTSGELVIETDPALTVGEGVIVAAGATLDVAGELYAKSLGADGTSVIGAGAIVSLSEGLNLSPDATIELAGTLDAQWLSMAGTNTVADGASLSVAGSLTLDSSLDLAGATLATIPEVTNIDVNTGAVLTLGQVLRGAELNVAGTVETAGAELTALRVTDGGLLSSSADVTAEDVSVTGGAIDLIGGANLNVATMQVTGGTVNTGAGYLVVGERLKIGDNTTISITGGTFQANSVNLADPMQPANLTLGGGGLTVGGGSVTPGGAIAIWKFREQDGLTTADSAAAGNDHPGTLNGATWAADDPEHLTALSFDGDGYVEIANTSDVELGEPFTMAMWIKTSQKGVKLVGKGHGDHNWQMFEKALYIDPTGGQLKFTGRMSGTVSGTTDVADDRWHHVAVTFNRGNAPGDQEIYVDGVNDTATRVYGNVLDNGSVFRLGWAETRDGGGYQEYIGMMDDVCLYDRSLSAEEVADLSGAFTSVLEPKPNINLRVTADSALYLDATSGAAVLGNLTLDSAVALRIAGAAVGFRDVTAGEGSSIQGDLSVGGTLSVGDSPGTLDVIGELTLPDGSIYEWELGPGTHDLVALEGDLTLAGGWTLRLIDAGGTSVASEEFDLFSYTGTYTGLPSFDGATIDGSGVEGSGRWDWSEAEINVDGNRVYLTGLIVVPEPGTLVLLISSVLGLLAYAWRRRRGQPASRCL